MHDSPTVRAQLVLACGMRQPAESKTHDTATDSRSRGLFEPVTLEAGSAARNGALASRT